MNFFFRLLAILTIGMLLNPLNGAAYDSGWTARQVDLFCYAFLLVLSVVISEFGLFRYGRWLPVITLAAGLIIVDMDYISGAAWFLIFGIFISPFMWALYLIFGMLWLFL